jgi:hypothetical protein
MSITPNLAGMADAQQRLRQLIGRDVRFYGPADVIYDPTVPVSAFDDEGIPLDPLALASGAALAAVGIDNLTIVGSAHVNVVFQPLSAMRRDEVEEDTLGWRSRLNKDLILDIADAPQAVDALYFEVGTLSRDTAGNIMRPEQWTSDDGELWKIVNSKTDGFGALQRLLVFGQGTR